MYPHACAHAHTHTHTHIRCSQSACASVIGKNHTLPYVCPPRDCKFLSILKNSFKNFIQLLNITFHLRLLQNTGYIPYIVLTPLSRSYTQQFAPPTPPPLYCPSSPQLVATSLFSIVCESVSFLLYSLVHCIF